MFEKDDLVKIARWNMPFGKYQGHLLLDLPEAYLLWFVDRGFPQGELGRLMQLCLEIKINGVEGLLDPFRPTSEPKTKTYSKTKAAYVFPTNREADD
ncbi:MAG: hypothetical protein ACI9SB_001139 [Candidatus Azotimanducaceae bacterium]|jgi:uncharacterized protein (DUF3820 family)